MRPNAEIFAEIARRNTSVREVAKTYGKGYVTLYRWLQKEITDDSLRDALLEAIRAAEPKKSRRKEND